MTRILSTAAVALAFTVALGAQSTPQSQYPSQPSTTKQTTKQKTTKTAKTTASSKSVTLAGCLREGDTPNSFALDNVQVSGPGSEPKESGVPSGMPGEMGQVKLVATADINLKEHVGHQVELTGMLTPAKTMTKEKSSTTTSDTMGSGSSASSSSATGTSGAKEKGANAETLKVRALKHISETCTTK